MELFRNGDAVRLRCHRGKFLFAEADQVSVRRDKNRLSNGARWTVEHVSGSNSVISLKSDCGKYLTASTEAFAGGLSSSDKVLQTLPSPGDTTVQWEPVNYGKHIRLKNCFSQKYLRGSGKLLPPWLDSVTHYPAEAGTKKSSLNWDVEINVDATPAADPAPRRGENLARVQIGVGVAGVATGIATATVAATNLATGGI